MKWKEWLAIIFVMAFVLYEFWPTHWNIKANRVWDKGKGYFVNHGDVQYGDAEKTPEMLEMEKRKAWRWQAMQNAGTLEADTEINEVSDINTLKTVIKIIGLVIILGLLWYLAVFRRSNGTFP